MHNSTVAASVVLKGNSEQLWQWKSEAVSVYEQILLSAKLQIGKRGKKTEVIGRSSAKRRRSALDCRAVEEEDEEEEKEEKEEEEGGGGGGGEEKELYP